MTIRVKIIYQLGKKIFRATLRLKGRVTVRDAIRAVNQKYPYFSIPKDGSGLIVQVGGQEVGLDTLLRHDDKVCITRVAPHAQK